MTAPDLPSEPWNFPQLPLLRYVERQLDVDTAQSLAGYSIICVQHLLASTGSLIASLVRCGADANRIHIVGKAYSTNDGVLERLRDCGTFVVNPGFPQEADEPYDSVLARAISLSLERLVQESARNESRKVLLIDDGGHALAAAHALSNQFRVSAVEQTTRGIRVASALSLRFCVVNVGRSRAKLELEAPLIASSMARNLDQLLTTAKGLVDGVECVLLIGYGAVGRAVALRLRAQACRLVIFDERRDARDAAAADGFSTIEDLNGRLGKCLVAASTGTVSFPPRLHTLLGSGSILANMGSSDLEFAAWELRESDRVRALFDKTGQRLERCGKEPPWDTHYLLESDGRDILLLKGGFPIDFDGGPDPIPAAAIQLTRSLILAGALQASTETRVGLVELDAAVHNEIVREYERLQRVGGS